MGFNCLKATATSRRQFTFYHSVPSNSWYSFYQPHKDERLSWPWSQPVVLNTEPLDWESSALTTAKVCLMLDNLFPVPSLCELSRISICFIQFSTKITCKQLIPFRESNVFLEVIISVLGRSVNFDIKISITTARVSRLSVSCDYAKRQTKSLKSNFF